MECVFVCVSHALKKSAHKQIKKKQFLYQTSTVRATLIGVLKQKFNLPYVTV